MSWTAARVFRVVCGTRSSPRASRCDGRLVDVPPSRADRANKLTVVVRPLEQRDAQACDEIVLGLPYHFGSEVGRRECAAAVRSQRGLVAEDGGRIVGFLTLQPRFDDALEITWMAVRAERRRQGIGRALIDRVLLDAVAERRAFLLLLTVSPNDEPDDIADGYQATRAFYLSNGFVLARDFAGYWPDDLPVLMIRGLAIGGGSVGR